MKHLSLRTKSLLAVAIALAVSGTAFATQQVATTETQEPTPAIEQVQAQEVSTDSPVEPTIESEPVVEQPTVEIDPVDTLPTPVAPTEPTQPVPYNPSMVAAPEAPLTPINPSEPIVQSEPLTPAN